MYELYKTSQCRVPAVLNGFTIEPNAHKLVYGPVPILEYQSVSRRVLYKPGRYYEDVQNRLKSHVSQMLKKLE
jgi:hypothetical protein